MGGGGVGGVTPHIFLFNVDIYFNFVPGYLLYGFIHVINERTGGVANGSKFRPNRNKKAYRDRGLLCIKLFCVISDDRLQYNFATACTNTIFLFIFCPKTHFQGSVSLNFLGLVDF